MADSPKPGGLAVRLPFTSSEEFLQRYGSNVTRGGIYLRAKSLRAPGTLTPPVVAEFNRTFTVVRALPCDRSACTRCR